MEACLRQTFPDGAPSYRVENRLTSEPPSDTAITAYRITQEALANIRKHAAATKVEVVLDEREGGMIASVLDDGVGFTADSSGDASPGHLGLTSMQERAEATGGWCRVARADGVGTLMECWLPLPLAPAA